jgi:histone H4
MARYKKSSSSLVTSKPKKIDILMEGLSKPAIKRLARRGGVKRIGGLVYPTTRNIARAFLSKMMRAAVIFADHTHRKTITAADIVYGLKRAHGTTVYGAAVPIGDNEAWEE